MANFAMLLISVALGAAGQFLFRLGMKSYGQVNAGGVFKNLFSIIFTPAIFVGFVLFGLSSIIWLSVISKNQLSYAYPMVSIGYIITFLLSAFLLHEDFGPFRIIGGALIILGVIFIAKS